MVVGRHLASLEIGRNMMPSGCRQSPLWKGLEGRRDSRQCARGVGRLGWGHRVARHGMKFCL